MRAGTISQFTSSNKTICRLYTTYHLTIPDFIMCLYCKIVLPTEICFPPLSKSTTWVTFLPGCKS
ncbi:hypothetical protein RvY_13232 [Ramazzottius varieornatus]|uniref:Uncharacterized protein n=1 Tax=Ramazzottius varieornatus TaxID=947166 RepID=A0A1D1VP24_RAMVA|nr:hypothetical protein RvY_13232 [Ramazzottius varieornatus]